MKIFQRIMILGVETHSTLLQYTIQMFGIANLGVLIDD